MFFHKTIQYCVAAELCLDAVDLSLDQKSAGIVDIDMSRGVDRFQAQECL